MTFKPAKVLTVLVAAAALPAFAQNAAVVNGKAIPTARVDAMVKAISAQGAAQGQQADPAQLREMVKRELINREVMLQEAVKQGYDKKPAVKEQLDNARQQIIIGALLRDYASSRTPKAADIQAEYDKYKAQAGDKEYHVRHILVENEADAKAVIAKLKGGAKFEDLAKTSKDQGSAANGGDLDWVAPSMLPKPFSDAFVGLQKGQVTENPVQTQNGWHVIKLDDVRPAKVATLEEVKPQIEEMLTQRTVQAYQEELVKKAKVQ